MTPDRSVKSRRWLIAALIVSIAVNFALAGYLAGRASMREFGPPPIDAALGAGQLLRELPDARRETLKPLLRAHMHALRPNLRTIRDAQSDIRSAILSEPFDPAALERALARFQEGLAVSQARGNASLVAFIAALEPAERAMLVERIGRPRPPAHARPRGDAPAR